MNKRFVLFLLCAFIFISCRSKKEKNDISQKYDSQDLINMINQNDINSIEKCLNEEFNLNQTIGDDNFSFLDYAIKQKKEEIAILLIRNGINVNHIDSKGVSSFTKAIGKMSSSLLNAFLEYGLDYTYIDKRNMNYFVYMLYKEDYSSAFNFITKQNVLEYFKKEKDLLVYLIYYWNSEWSSKIGNFLLSNGYQYDKELPYYFYAIDEFSLESVIWLDSIGILKSGVYYEERYNIYFTPLEYTENKILEMTHFLGKDNAYSQNDSEIIALERIMDFLNN